MKLDKRKIIVIFAVSFFVSCAASAIMHLGDWLGFRSQLIYLFYITVGLLSFPWIYLASVISPEVQNMLGEAPTAIFRAIIIALGLSINAVLAYLVFFVRKWKWKPELEKRIKVSKYLIYVIAGMTILAGIITGYIIPHLGGHGPSFSWWDVPFIFGGGLVGCLFAYLSVLASMCLEREDELSAFYVYAWCAAMIMIGATGLMGIMVTASDSDTVLMILAVALFIPGIIGVLVLFTKRAQRASAIT